MAQTDKSVLIVSENGSFADTMREALASDHFKLTSHETSFKGMNGKASDLTARFDAVIFDTDPDDADELSAIGEVIAEQGKSKVFLALTDGDISIAKARSLRDAGVDEVLPLTIKSDTLAAEIDGAWERKHPAPVTQGGSARAPGHVIALAQARGGIGATTVAVNLACGLVGKSRMFRRAEPKKVALLDLDLQFGNANVFLDLEDNNGFADMIQAPLAPDQRFLEAVFQHHESGLDVLCAPNRIMPLDLVRAEYLEVTLNYLTANYDYVVVDLPRAMVDWVAPALARASLLTVVSDTSVPCIRQARRFLDFVREDNISLEVDIVINREKRPFLKSEHLREAENVLETKLKNWLPDNPKIARAAADLGRPVILSHPKSDLGKAYARLVGAYSETLTTARTKAA